MSRQVTIRNFNQAIFKHVFSMKTFWLGLGIYILGVIVLAIRPLCGGILMVLGSLIMLGADMKSKALVLKDLQWKK